MGIVSLTVRLHNGGDLSIPASYQDPSNDDGTITNRDKQEALNALSQRLQTRESPIPTTDFRTIIVSEVNSEGHRVSRTFTLLPRERFTLVQAYQGRRSITTRSPISSGAVATPPAAATTPNPRAPAPTTPQAPAALASSSTVNNLPTNLDRAALDRLLRISPDDRSNAQKFLILIARSQSICSANVNGVESRGGLDRYESLDQLVTHDPRSFSSNEAIPVPVLNGTQETQLIRWLERSSIPSGPSFIAGGTRYRSALATEFSDVHTLIYQANHQAPGTSRLSAEGSHQTTEGPVRDFTERQLEPQDVRVLAGLLRGRENNHPDRPLVENEITRARQYAVAYFRVVNYFLHLTDLPTLPPTSNHPVGSGGSTSGRRSNRTHDNYDGSAF